MSFVAISKVKYPPHLRKAIQAAGLEMLPVARAQAGLIFSAFHQSEDRDETMMYLEWESQAHHEACMQSKDWNAVLSEHKSVFSNEGVEFASETFKRLG